MKSVMISIDPKWCSLIASGEKTIEVRKTKPRLETPFKCYIYCTGFEHFYSFGGQTDDRFMHYCPKCGAKFIGGKHD